MSPLLFHLFLHAGHALDSELQLRMARLGVSHRQARVLDAIERLEARATQADVSRRLGISAPSLSVMLARMERNGLLERLRTDEDSRAARLALTPCGVRGLEAARQVWVEVETRVRRALGESGVEPAREMLKSVRDLFDANSPDDIVERP